MLWLGRNFCYDQFIFVLYKEWCKYFIFLQDQYNRKQRFIICNIHSIFELISLNAVIETQALVTQKKKYEKTDQTAQLWFLEPLGVCPERCNIYKSPAPIQGSVSSDLNLCNLYLRGWEISFLQIESQFSICMRMNFYTERNRIRYARGKFDGSFKTKII